VYFRSDPSRQQIVSDTDYYLVVAKVTERLAMSKQRSNSFLVERFNLKKLNKVEGKEKYRVGVLNRFAAFKDSDGEVEINSAWKTTNITAKESLGYYELK
jgi:hypothetical protein